MSKNYEYFGKYVLLEKIASGGMAEVFLARSNGVGGIGRFFAIKRILPQFSDNHDFLRMFKDEAKIAMNLSHSNVVSIYEFGTESSQLFLVMDYVEGKNLRQVTNKLTKAKKKFSVEQIVYIINKVAGGLDHAHRCLDGTTGKPLNITHRDISPQNVMVSYEGEVKIVDFGIAKAESQIENTRAGTLKGKFGYMSPEQAEGLTVDLRTDIFSLGIVLWELLTGERLFISNNEINTLRKIRECQIPSVKQYNPNIHPELERIVAKALTRDRNLRYQTAAGMHRDLNRFLNRQYPDFSPQDFSVSIKTLFADDVLEVRNKLVQFAQSPINKKMQEQSRRLEKSGIFLDEKSISISGADSFINPNGETDNESPFEIEKMETVTMSTPDIQTQEHQLSEVHHPQLSMENSFEQDFSIDNSGNENHNDKTEVLNNNMSPENFEKSQNISAISTETHKVEIPSDEGYADHNVPDRLRNKIPGKTAHPSVKISNPNLVRQDQFYEQDMGAEPHSPQLTSEDNRFKPYQGLKMRNHKQKNSLGRSIIMGLLILITLSIPAYFQAKKTYPEELKKVKLSLHISAKSLNPQLGEMVFPPQKKPPIPDVNDLEDPGMLTRPDLELNNIKQNDLSSKELIGMNPTPPKNNSPATVRMTFQSQPSGAEIYIDNVNSNYVTPATIEVPRDQAFNVSLKRRGYVEYNKSNVKSHSIISKKITATLIEVKLASLKIDVNPPRNARVYIDGKWLQGETLPISYKIQANSNVTIKAYNPYTKQTDTRVVNLRPNTRNSILLKLKSDAPQ